MSKWLKYSQIGAQKSFGLKCKSPKEKEKTRRIRENRALMCGFGREVSPKDGAVGIGSDISAEHEIHAQNSESPDFHILGAFARENLCIRLFGGGIVPSAKSDGGFLSSPKAGLVSGTSFP